MPVQPADTGCAARTSASTPSILRTSAINSGSGCCSCARSAVSSRLSSTIRWWPTVEYRVAGPGSHTASARHAASASARGRRHDVVHPATGRRRRGPSSSLARRHNAATSAAPSRQRGPVSTRTAATPAVGSAASLSIATTSATSATANSPPSPTTSTGMPRALSASAIGAASALRRNRTAVVGIGVPDSRASLEPPRDVIGDPVPLGRDVGHQRTPDVARLRVRPRH